jgi:DNA-binding phage protein
MEWTPLGTAVFMKRHTHQNNLSRDDIFTQYAYVPSQAVAIFIKSASRQLVAQILLDKTNIIVSLTRRSLMLHIQHFTLESGVMPFETWVATLDKRSKAKVISKRHMNFGDKLMHRHESYDEKLASELQDQEFAKDFILDLIEGDEGLTPLEALRHTIRRMGVKEFSVAAKIPYESVCRMLESDSLPKISTLDRYFAFFGLKVKIVLEDAA